MRSWLNTSKLLKTTSFILLVILTICVACPKGQAAADDGDYPDHENNIPPYVHSIIALFDNSPTTGHCTVQDIEFWRNGNSLGYADNLYNISVPASADCIDVDIQIPIAAPSGNSVICLFNLYAIGITNVDYIEFYKQTSYEAVPVYYYTYYSNQFYWITSGQNITASAYYTLRIHIKQGGFNITRYNYANTVTINSYEPANNSSFQEQYTQWYYLTSLLRELDGLSISTGNITVDVDNMEASIDSILKLLQNMRYGHYYYLEHKEDGILIGRIFNFNTNGTAYNIQNIYNDTTGTISISGDFAIALNFEDSVYTFNQYYFPLGELPSTYWLNSYDISVAVIDNLQSASVTIAPFDYKYSNFVFPHVSSDQGKYFLILNSYFPVLYDGNGTYPYVLFKFTRKNADAQTFTLDLNIAFDKSSFHAFGLPQGSQQGFEKISIAYFDKFYDLLHSIADNTQYVPPPVGSNPETNITNIYDVDVEFNNSIGDISLFESNYQQQLTVYDTQVSGNYLIPVSEQYTFGRLNIEFQYIWSHMFSYDLDEDNNKIGVYGLGLYFLIPLILFVICALFRRVTS